MDTSSARNREGLPAKTRGILRRYPVTMIVFSTSAICTLLAIIDAILVPIGVPEESVIALSVSLTALLTVASLEGFGCYPMEVFGRSQGEKLLALIAGSLMLVIVGGCVAGLTTPDLRAKLLLGPGAYFEELLFRGVPILLLARGGHSTRAKVGGAIVASIIFSIMHPSAHVVMYLDMVVFSLLAFWMAFASRSLWPAVAFHLLANFAAITVASPLYGSDTRGLFVLVDFALFLIVWLLALAAAGIIRRKQARS